MKSEVMTIERVINGRKIPIDLTEDEILKAYDIQEHVYDMNDIQDMVDWYDNDEEVIDQLGAPTSFIEKNLNGIAYEMRRLLNKYPYKDPENAGIDAIKTLYHERCRL